MEKIEEKKEEIVEVKRSETKGKSGLEMPFEAAKSQDGQFILLRRDWTYFHLGRYKYSINGAFLYTYGGIECAYLLLRVLSPPSLLFLPRLSVSITLFLVGFNSTE